MPVDKSIGFECVELNHYLSSPYLLRAPGDRKADRDKSVHFPHWNISWE